MNWKSPTELRWHAESLRATADEIEEVAKQLEILQAAVTREPREPGIEEGDMANG